MGTTEPTLPDDEGADEQLDTQYYVAGAQGGDPLALEEMFQRIRPRLEGWIALRMGPRLRSRLDIEDVVQEVSLHAFKDLEGFQANGTSRAFWNWILTIAEHRIRDLNDYHFKTQKRAADREEALRSTLQASWNTASMTMRVREEHERMLEAFKQLDDPQREILRLCTFEQRSYKEVADLLDLTETNVGARLSRAKRAWTRLRKAAEDDAEEA